MLRITQNHDGTRVVLKLEGKLVGPWVDELRRVLESESHSAELLSLDANGLSFVDLDGERLLREWLQRGAELASPMGFVGELLRTEGGKR